MVDGPAGVVGYYRIESLAAVAPTRVFAAGERQDTHFTLAARWNGTAWKLLATASPSQQLNDLAGLARIPDTRRVWAAGT